MVKVLHVGLDEIMMRLVPLDELNVVFEIKCIENELDKIDFNFFVLFVSSVMVE